MDLEKQPGFIRKLDETVVNRIAAGEIIQRPVSALKEMLENSIDAKSTNIQISIKNGGLKYLQIQDNGTGIRKDDLGIVCERFTTSKLSNFDDLSTISTYGFRGEALASISHVARLTILTKTVQEKCAYKCTYQDGKLIGQPKPIAGNQGTQITVEDLFYNCQQRLQALNSPNAEYQRILDVVQKYAIHNAHVGFTLKKIGDIRMMKTPANSTCTKNIGLIYGSEMAKELMEISMTENEYGFKFHSVFTNPNYASKKYIFILFINHRLVESKNLKQMLDDVFSVYLQKGRNPFVYINIEIEPNQVDVNIHPTKHEVRFLYETEIITKIKKHFEDKLTGSNQTRKFIIEQYLPKHTTSQILNKSDQKQEALVSKIYDKDLVRCDSNLQKLEKFFGPSTQLKNDYDNEQFDQSTASAIEEKHLAIEDLTLCLSEDSNSSCNDDETIAAKCKVATSQIDKQLVFDVVFQSQSSQNTKNHLKQENSPDTVNNSIDEISIDDMPKDSMSDLAESHPISSSTQIDLNATQNGNDTLNKTNLSFLPKFEEIESKSVKINLTSVLELRSDIERNCSVGLRKILSNLVFVGSVDRTYSLIQYEIRLYLINTHTLCIELFYQLLLYDFGNFGIIKFTEPLSIQELAELAFEHPDSGWSEKDGTKKELARRAQEILTDHAQMLKEYFSFSISDDGMLETIPLLLANYMPSLGHLPMYILRLATEVEWTIEKDCFQSFCRETALFYAEFDQSISEIEWKWTNEFVVYAAFKKYLLPPQTCLRNKSFLQLTTLPELYKVFERC